jgi:hypothetical protein
LKLGSAGRDAGSGRLSSRVCLGELRKKGSGLVLEHPRAFAVESAGE